MRQNRHFCPKWSWWIRAGERAVLGLELGHIIGAAGPGVGPAERNGLKCILGHLNAGSGMVEAMREASLCLPVEAWSLLQAGEHTGKFGEAMCDVGELLRQQEARRRAFFGQMWYPAMVGLVGIGVMAIILFWVVPQMRELSESMGLGDNLPWLTEHIGQLYGGIFSGIITLLLLGLAGFSLIRLIGKRSAKWGYLEEVIAGRFPVAGSVFRHVREARLLRQLGTLLQAGTPIPRALEMVAASSSNRWEQEELTRFRSSLLMGMGFSVSLRACPLFDEEGIPLLEVGQESGKLESFMLRIAAGREEEVAWAIAQITRLVEPLFLFVLSGAIGGMVLAYLLPMVRLLEQAGGAF
ncbi:type II secretion system F family protein [Puniceicoccales bacterium CK1056]|uniref:Type II secretion system F family protein n=1 Tax=Oceanipulchritudo coccoides TaxID=2706888 RepID=A0A6B2LZB5_9BACT|nr:type II secretion system F family protein [Oceanipulchritudo coccoides]NDV61998.1 type II secretion system F family protein [Oceanipulchritudo coccoides]